MTATGFCLFTDKGAAKIARQLGFDYAEAVVRTRSCSLKWAAAISPDTRRQTGFEFRKGKAFPVISGIVVAAENEDTILEASWEAEHAAAEKEQEKRQQAVLKRWTKLVQGLRIRQRMREEYGAQGAGTPSLRDAGSSSAVARGDGDEGGDEDGTQLATATAGGFLTSVEDVIQPYSLPRPAHAVFSSPPRSPIPSGRASPAPVGPASPASPFADAAWYNDDDEDEEEDVVEEPRLPTEDLDVDTGASSRQHPRRRMPKSMAALAAEVAALANAAVNEEDAASASATVPAPVLPDRTVARRAVSRPKSMSKTRATKPNTRAGTGTGRTKAQAQGRRKRGWGRGRGDEADASGSGFDLEDTASDGERPDRDVDMGMGMDVDADAGGAGAGADGAVRVPRSDRVLRARKGKSAEQVARERERELAVKRALAG